MTDTWPACATYPNLGCVCRGALGQNKSTCTRKRTGDLQPIRTAGGPPMTEHNTSGGLTEGLDPDAWGKSLTPEERRSVLDEQRPAYVLRNVERILADRLAAVQAERDRDKRIEVAWREASEAWQVRAESAEAENARLRAELAAEVRRADKAVQRANHYEGQFRLRETEPDVRAGNARPWARLGAVEALFAGGPDTPCRMTWRREEGLWGEEGRVECVEVPIAALRAALDSPTSHTQQEADDEDTPPTPYDPDDAEEAEFLGIAPPHAQREAEVGARVLREFADWWDDPANVNALTEAAQLHYRAGGPSMPAIVARLRADALAADTTNPAPTDQETP